MQIGMGLSAESQRANVPAAPRQFRQQFVQVGRRAARFGMKDAGGDEQFHQFQRGSDGGVLSRKPLIRSTAS